MLTKHRYRSGSATRPRDPSKSLMFSSFNLSKVGRRCDSGGPTLATVLAFVYLAEVWPGSPCRLGSESEASRSSVTLSHAQKSRGSFQGGATKYIESGGGSVRRPSIATAVTGSP